MYMAVLTGAKPEVQILSVRYSFRRKLWHTLARFRCDGGGHSQSRWRGMCFRLRSLIGGRRKLTSRLVVGWLAY